MFIIAWWCVCSITPIFINPEDIYVVLHNQCVSSLFLGAGLIFVSSFLGSENRKQVLYLSLLTMIFLYYNTLVIEELINNESEFWYDNYIIASTLINALELLVLIKYSVMPLWKRCKSFLSGWQNRRKSSLHGSTSSQQIQS